MSPQELREQCTSVFSGHRPVRPGEEFADLLGMESALFFITGTQAQTLRIACEQRGSRRVALHPTAHILLHEKNNYQLLDYFQPLAIGDPFCPWGAADLEALPEKIGAASYELPMREISGQLPEWEELAAIKRLCREQDIHLHTTNSNNTERKKP